MKQAKEMQVTLNVNLGNVVDYVRVSMQAFKFRKCNDKSDGVNWFMVTHQKDMDTLVNTLVQVNKMNVVTKQSV
ncbi:hypothetical protein H5410_046060 [Solanum commersonii]|uniref:Uncharacterized protein n=1 Tax=Solanum commersonii TaxID=4109 RepID=A0A9J5XD26_SOLCO|nr:hypothetical protein H5410_046060 [Solanum commersonii]